MNNGLISIVVPVYNTERYLNSCINSIVNQSYPNLEIILVDDGSKDSSPAMCDAWAKKDSRIRVIHKENAGAGFARNSGIEIATGEYICFFDSDDFLAEDALEKAYRMAERERADVVIFGAYNLDEKGRTTKVVIPNTEKPVFTGSEVQRVFLPDLIENGYTGAQNTGLCLSFWVNLFSMDLIRRSNWQIVSEREYASEDSFSLLKLYHYVNKVVVLPEALYYYRILEGSLSRTYKREAFSNMRKCYQSCISLSKQLEYPEEVCKRLAGFLLSQACGIFKQLVLTDLDRRQKKAILKELVADDVLQDALTQIHWTYASKKKQCLLNCMRKELYRCVYCLILLQQYKTKLRK